MMFIKYAAVQLQQLGLRKQMDMFGKDKPNLAIEEKDRKDQQEVRDYTYQIISASSFDNGHVAR